MGIQVFVRGWGCVVAALVSLAIAPPVSQAAVQTVFDNTLGLAAGPFFGPGCCRIGNQIQFAGDDRHVVLVTLVVDSQDHEVDSELEVRLYANDGTGGAPGTLLWDSGLMPVHVRSDQVLLDVFVPSVEVPDTITVTSQFIDPTPVALGRFEPGSPAVGTFDRNWLERAPGEWGPGFSFAMRVVASDIAEPATAALALVALVAVALSRGGRQRNVGGNN